MCSFIVAHIHDSCALFIKFINLFIATATTVARRSSNESNVNSSSAEGSRMQYLAWSQIARTTEYIIHHMEKISFAFFPSLFLFAHLKQKLKKTLWARGRERKKSKVIAMKNEKCECVTRAAVFWSWHFFGAVRSCDERTQGMPKSKPNRTYFTVEFLYFSCEIKYVGTSCRGHKDDVLICQTTMVGTHIDFNFFNKCVRFYLHYSRILCAHRQFAQQQCDYREKKSREKKLVIVT